MLWELDDRVNRSRLDESVLDGAHYACHLHRESLAQWRSPQFSHRDGTHCLWDARVHRSHASFRAVCAVKRASSYSYDRHEALCLRSAFYVDASIYYLIFSPYLNSIRGKEHTMAIAVQKQSSVEEISHAHGGCTCNPCTCNPCTCGSTVASV